MIQCQANKGKVEEIKETILASYNYLSDKEIDAMFNIAVGDYLRLKYPSINSQIKPEALNYDFVTSQWIIARIIDILGRAGGLSVTAYKENNLNLTYGASYIDPELRKQIMPKAGVPK